MKSVCIFYTEIRDLSRCQLCRHRWQRRFSSSWRHQKETLSVLLALCDGYSPVTGEFPSQRPVTRSFGVFFDLRLSKRMSKPSRCRWFETPSRSLWRQGNVTTTSGGSGGRRHSWHHDSFRFSMYGMYFIITAYISRTDERNYPSNDWWHIVSLPSISRRSLVEVCRPHSSQNHLLCHIARLHSS